MTKQPPIIPLPSLELEPVIERISVYDFDDNGVCVILEDLHLTLVPEKETPKPPEYDYISSLELIFKIRNNITYRVETALNQDIKPEIICFALRRIAHEILECKADDEIIRLFVDRVKLHPLGEAV